MIRVYLRQWGKEKKSWQPVLEEILERDYGLTEIRIRRDAYGKPFLEGNRLYFNISHSGDYLAAAVSEQPVGIDIEGMRPVREGMYRKVVRQMEQELIGSEREKDFIRLWTLKESFTKAEGQGLRIPLKEYYFRREKDGMRVYYQGEKAPWLFYVDEAAADGYIVSVCGLDKEVLIRTE